MIRCRGSAESSGRISNQVQHQFMVVIATASIQIASKSAISLEFFSDFVPARLVMDRSLGAFHCLLFHLLGGGNLDRPRGT
jgi:hypothetical protein